MIRQASIVLVLDPSNHLLMLHRGPTAPTHPGKWNFPGGYVDASDASPLHAALRELREEAGLVFRPNDLISLFSYREQAKLIHVFGVRVSEQVEVSFPDAEHDRFRWCPTNECRRDAVPAVAFILNQIGSTRVSRHALPNGRGGDIISAEGKRMSKFVTSDYMASWPKAVPFPYSISRSTRPVPNSNAVNWPQSQFAPLYLSPGSPSFQPYSYFKEDVPLKSEEPEYLTANFFPYARSGVGPGGDTSALPNFGDPMSRAPVRRKVSASSQAARVRAKLKSARKRLDSVAVDKLQDRLDRLRAAAQNENTAVRNTYRMGMINTGVPIESGVPNPRRSSPPPSHMVPNRSGHSATGLDLGDGFAYELAPLQAQVNANFQHRTATDLGNLAGDCDCGGRSNPSEEGGSGRLLLVGGLIGAGIAAWYLTSRSTV